MTLVQRILDYLSNALLALSGVALMAMMALACANMVMGGLGRPIKGTVELIEFFGALTVAFALAATQRKKGHIALTILAGAMPKGVERTIDFLSTAASCLLFSLIGWRLVSMALDKMASGLLSETLRFPFYPVILAVALGVFLMALILAADAVAVFVKPSAAKGGTS